MMDTDVTDEGEIVMSTPGAGAEPPKDPSDPYADLRHRPPEPPAYPAYTAPAGESAVPLGPPPATYPGPQPAAGAPAYPGPQPEYAPWGTGAPAYRPASGRPGTVIAATIMVWVGATVPAVIGMIALFGGGIAAWIFSQAGVPDDLGMPSATIPVIIVVIAAAFLLWAALMVWAGVAAFRGQNWGRWVLAVQGGLYLLGVVGARLLALDPSVILDLAYVGGCLTLLFLPPSSRWYAQKRS